MVSLLPYTEVYEEEMKDRIVAFFSYHGSLITEISEVERQKLRDDAKDTLRSWQEGDNELYVIMKEGQSAGFLRLNYRGPIVAWIEDIFVDEEKRGQGIATAAFAAAEEVVRSKPGYEALCLDVVPRNADAMRLYHKLGFTDLSMITLRKELGESRRSQPLNLFGLEFKY